MTLIPAPLLFRYSLPVAPVAQGLDQRGEWPELGDAHRVFAPSSLEESALRDTEWRLGWHQSGLAVEVAVHGAKARRSAKAAQSTRAAIPIWIDTRGAQNVHRASRFSHSFIALPFGDGKTVEPAILQQPIPRAREDAPLCDPRDVKIAIANLTDGYRVRVWFSARSLHGYDPASYQRLSFYGAVHDARLNLQPFALGLEFPVESDPSFWIELELQDK